jgi:hypothetical protein
MHTCNLIQRTCHKVATCYKCVNLCFRFSERNLTATTANAIQKRTFPDFAKLA